MTQATTNDLLTYLADLVDELERYAVTVLLPGDNDEITLGQDRAGGLVIDLDGRLPVARRSRDVDIALFERWRAVGPDRWTCAEYSYELRHHELGYRRAFHRHDEDDFARTYGVATHEHCEATMGVEACGHYFGQPMADAFDGFHRLYGIWLADQKPDCLALICLE